MQVDSRTETALSDSYKGFSLVRLHGCLWAVPPFLDPEGLRRPGRLRSHPAILKASTRRRLEALIDGLEGGWRRPGPEFTESYEGLDVVRWGNALYAGRQDWESLNLDLDEELVRAGVIKGKTVEEVRQRIRTLKDAVPVEFAGWLPIYKYMGNCGKHPQFAHTATPPEGYRFVRSGPPEDPDAENRTGGLELLAQTVAAAVLALGLLVRPLFILLGAGPRVRFTSRWRLLVALTRLFFRLVKGGGKMWYVLRFLRSRHFSSQMLLADYRGLVFLASAPYTYNQNPWVIEIEDPTTLFFPFIQNGRTCDINASESPYFPIVKTLLESDQCKGIITHIRSTARLVPALFGSETIARKVHYIPLGVKTPERWQRHDIAEPEHINLLFINSWSQNPGNFQVRGGYDVLEAFSILHERYPQIRLTLRTNLLPVDEHYYRIIESGWVRVISRFLSTQEMEALHSESHIFLLPAARIHIVSVLQAMASGLVVVASDGWGIEEYINHERNGLIVKGRYGQTSWADEKAGMLREDYSPTHTADTEVVNGIVEAVSRLVEDHELRRRLGRAARKDVETLYSLRQWNEGLKKIFDQALSRE
jgi:glycosyltransferase involved in cell wall biosynthesis